MELRQLEIVVAVAEHLNFGRAAQVLHLGQPAVSQQVARLERELGTRLFDRTSRTVSLTDAGRRFVAQAHNVLAAVECARASASAPERTALRIGTSSGLGEHLARLVATLAQSAPHLSVELHGMSTRERVDRVRAGRLDAAFLRGTHVLPDLEIVPVWDDELVIALPATHPLAGSDPVPVGGLRDLPLRLVSRALNQPLVDLVLAACAVAGFEPARLPTAGRIEDTLALVGAGDPSWAVMYAAHAQGIRSERVVFRAVDPPMAMPTSCAMSAHAGSALLSPLLAAFQQ